LAAISSRNIWHASTAEAVFAGAGRIARRTGALTAPAAAQAPPATTTPIEHLIVVVGENLRVDNLFGVYEPRSGEWPVPDHQKRRR
jgi:phospholipase C